MGRGRAKAKQTKVARDLKYRTHETDFGALAKELHGDESTDRPTWSTTSTSTTSGRTTPTPLTRLTPGRVLPEPASVPLAQGSQIPRSLPAASAIRCSAIRSAATAGGTPVGLGQREHLPRRVEDHARPGCLARSKSKPCSSSATWIRPPALTT